jgi:hypothetical protein
MLVNVKVRRLEKICGGVEAKREIERVNEKDGQFHSVVNCEERL